MDTLGTLSIFVHAAETRNFTRTAQRLGLSASAIAKSIARLEDRMGIRLFHRSTRNVMLTHEGEMLLESCRRIIEEVEMIEERFTRRGKAPSGRLRVIAQIPSAYIAPLLRKFIVAFPEIELDMEWGTGAAGLIEKRIRCCNLSRPRHRLSTNVEAPWVLQDLHCGCGILF
ncbi:LysR family transcriptional regulator [Paraburkholderia atlantica]|uniref:LysR family transcriptional regulator n=1 Tax=Paraburkholderia atlantica TaxID=2654982 RepID=UPI003D23E84A